MKTLVISIFLIVPLSLRAQEDSIKVFVIGNKKGESYKIYYNGNKVLEFKASYSYKYSFNILREPTFIEGQTIIRKIGLYKKMLFKYRLIGIYPLYENKKYLVIRRNMALRKRFLMDYNWTDVEPKLPAGHR